MYAYAYVMCLVCMHVCVVCVVSCMVMCAVCCVIHGLCCVIGVMRCICDVCACVYVCMYMLEVAGRLMWQTVPEKYQNP